MQFDCTPVQIPLLARDGSVVGFTLVDAADADWGRQWTWRLQPGRRTSYAIRGETIDGIYVKVRLHREIMGLPRRGAADIEVDHRNHCGTDNRRCNLIIVTPSEQPQNKPRYLNNTSGFRGVSWHKQHQKWIAYASIGSRKYHLGLFNTPEEANTVVSEWRRTNMPFSVEC